MQQPAKTGPKQVFLQHQHIKLSILPKVCRIIKEYGILPLGKRFKKLTRLKKIGKEAPH